MNLQGDSSGTQRVTLVSYWSLDSLHYIVPLVKQIVTKRSEYPPVIMKSLVARMQINLKERRLTIEGTRKISPVTSLLPARVQRLE